MTDTPPIEHPVWLTTGDFTEADEPLALFAAWMAEAVASEPRDPNAMALATIGADGIPDVRMVLMKGFDAQGFVFYTNIGSQKGRELKARAQGGAPVLLEDRSTGRSACAARSRPSPTRRPTPISRPARAARRSAPGPPSNPSRSKAGLRSRKRSRVYTAKFGIGAVPRPPHWSGYRIVPHGDRILARPPVPPA